MKIDHNQGFFLLNNVYIFPQSGDHSEIIKHMARLVDSIEVPAAKAAILWVMGEYCERVPKIAPDVLRKMAKTFTNEEPAVKMQVNGLEL